MTARRPSQASTSAIDEYAGRFDDLFNRVTQRHCFRQYIIGLLLPLETNKHLSGIAAAVPGAEMEALQHFLVEASWLVESVNAQRLAQLKETEATRCTTWACSSSTKRETGKKERLQRTPLASIWGVWETGQRGSYA